jgi:hypothetical protein
LLVAALLLLIVGMGGVIWWEARPAPKEEAVTRAFYTTDDGKTWFTDDAERLPPFDHGGKQAVRLYLFSCDRFGWNVKRPGDAHWVNSKADADAYQKIMDVKCPDGAVALPVLPKNDE